MKLSQRLRQERDYVERKLGTSVICRACKATLATYHECPAALQEPCDGFLAIEAAREEFANTPSTEAYDDALRKLKAAIKAASPASGPKEGK